MSKVLHRLAHHRGRPEDPEDLLHIARNIQGRTVCAFGEACAWPVLSFIGKFRDEFDARSAAGAAARDPRGTTATRAPDFSAH